MLSQLRLMKTNKVVYLTCFALFLVVISMVSLLDLDTATFNRVKNNNYVWNSPYDDTVSSQDAITWENYNDYTIPIDFGNSTMIFNSIFAALKQSPSDIHPLGLTFFPATVPKGTLLYHTTSESAISDSFEWLALDAEFSFSFGVKYSSYGRNSTKGGFGRFKPHKPKTEDAEEHDSEIPPPPPATAPPHEPFKKNHFWTFQTTRELNRLIYLDGASAAKSETGEMDTQKLLNDVIAWKLNITDDNGKKGPQEKIRIERLYAERICQWGKPLGLDGYIRMEIGFEIILCDFFNGSVDLVSNITIPDTREMLGIDPPVSKTVEDGWPIDDEGNINEDELTKEQIEILDREDEWQRVIKKYSSMQGFDWLRAGSIHDGGESRVGIDYRHMVTGINRTAMDPNPYGRRLLHENMTWDEQVNMVNELENALVKGFSSEKSNDWQAILQEVIDKFSPMLNIIQHLANNKDLANEEIALEITRYTFNFVLRFSQGGNFQDGVLGSGKSFAIYQYSKPVGHLQTTADYLIWSSNVRIVTEIVNTLYDVHDKLMPIVKSSMLGRDDDAEQDEEEDDSSTNIIASVREQVNTLVEGLHWISLHYECDRKCEWDEICHTPAWGPSPLSWNSAGRPSGNGTSRGPHRSTNFGVHFDESVGRQVIDNQLQCIKADLLLH